VLHEIESYLSFRCAIEWHEQLYGDDFEIRLAKAMSPPGGPIDIYRHLARNLIDYILHNRLPVEVSEKRNSISAV
jgi:hypothetical protein